MFNCSWNFQNYFVSIKQLEEGYFIQNKRVLWQVTLRILSCKLLENLPGAHKVWLHSYAAHFLLFLSVFRRNRRQTLNRYPWEKYFTIATKLKLCRTVLAVKIAEKQYLTRKHRWRPNAKHVSHRSSRSSA